jgi:selenocysteine-specific elongation factor
VHLRCLETVSRGITNRRRVRFHLATQEVMGRVVLLEGNRLEPGGDGVAQIRLEKPVVARKGDRFVIRSYSPIRTIGGGVVVRPFTRRRTKLTPDELELLEVLITGNPAEEILALVRAGRHEGIEVARLPLLTGLPPAAIERTVGELAAGGEVAAYDGYLFHRSALRSAKEGVREYLEQQHRNSPLRTGFPLEEMRKKVFPHSPGCFVEQVISELTGDGTITLKGGLIKLSSHEIALADEDARIHRYLVRTFGEAGLAPPSLDQLAGELGVPETRLLELVAVLKDTG